MSRTIVPFAARDISALARSLQEQLEGREHPPSHLELLNMLARATGYRNFQALRAQAEAQHLLDHPRPVPPPVDPVQVKRLLRHFDATGRLDPWPSKPSVQETCLWVLWSRLPGRESLIEAKLNQLLRANHGFGDHALLRRELCDRGLVARTPDGREYRRVERRPPPEALALIHHLEERRLAAGGAQ